MSVSILLPVFNRAHTLARCLESVRAQSHRDWELIAVDDASTDESQQILQAASAEDARIRVLRHAQNRGPSGARNTGLSAATREFVALIDSDDEWLPQKLERQMAVLEKGFEGCGCQYWLVENGTEKLIAPRAEAGWPAELERRCELGNGTTLLARRACLAEVGPLDEGMRIYEDWDWMLRFARRFPYTVAPEPLARVHVSGPRDPKLFAEGAERFLQSQDAPLAAQGRSHRRNIRGLHYEYVAGNALAQRRFALGLHYVLKSCWSAPLRRPALLGALLLAPIDALFGSSLLPMATARFGRQ